MPHTVPDTEHRDARRSSQLPTTHRDAGFSFLEMLVVITLLGILATIVAVAAGGINTQAAETGCRADERIVYTAVNSYLVAERVRTIPATGTDHDRYERTLVDAGHLRSVSSMYDVSTDGTMTLEGTLPC
jgi:prepilin-type N-terminal cleavage/methylation domain-containing protein